MPEYIVMVRRKEIAILWSIILSLIDSCQESIISIDTTFLYYYENGSSGEAGQLKVCYEGEELHICHEGGGSYNFDTRQATIDFCQSAGYNCELKVEACFYD